MVVDECEGNEVWLLMSAEKQVGAKEKRSVVVDEYKGDGVWDVAVHECQGASERRCFISVCKEQRND